MPPVPFPLENLLRQELVSSERLIWRATPQPSRLARKKSTLLVFGLLWIGFTIFSLTAGGAFRAPAFGRGPGWLPFFSLPGLFVGLGLILSPLWAARKARSTVYAVTNRRALILEPRLFGGVSVRSFSPSQLTDLRRVQLPDGSGDLILYRDVRSDAEGGRFTTEVGFFGIPDVKQVETLVRALADPPTG